jgi:hypothetical protein
MKILGLDASTTTIGVAVIETTTAGNKLIHSSYFKPSKEGHIFERLTEARQFVYDLIDQHKPDEVVIEDIIAFMAGGSTASTTLLLNVWNKTCGLAVFDKLGKPPQMINVLALRHALKENKIFPKKEEMPELVAKKLGITFPYVYITKGKYKDNIAAESYDMADAIALALGYAIKPELGIKKAKKKKVKKSKK